MLNNPTCGVIQPLFRMYLHVTLKVSQAVCHFYYLDFTLLRKGLIKTAFEMYIT